MLTQYNSPPSLYQTKQDGVCESCQSADGGLLPS
jgi:hypothetical protein